MHIFLNDESFKFSIKHFNKILDTKNLRKNIFLKILCNFLKPRKNVNFEKIVF